MKRLKWKHQPSVPSATPKTRSRVEDLRPRARVHLSSLSENARQQPISILKPVKGCEEGLLENIESFFRLDYPRYELLFSLADASDPARPVIEKLIAKYPRVRARLFIGEIHVGPNPKVNNMMRAYGEARHDWILVSDSNIRAKRDYLKWVAEPFTNDVGVVSAIVTGADPKGLGGWLETVFLNTFYARWMVLAGQFRNPVVIGKSMLFRRSEMARFGGMQALGRYLAEDYMAGQAMRFLGKKVELMREPVVQPIGRYSFKAFWSRHLRWGRIRKSQAPLPFVFEPFLSALPAGVIGAASAKGLYGIPFHFTFLAHVLLWFLSDAFLMKTVGGSASLKTFSAWLLRESLHLPLWFHILLGRTVNWRGRVLTLARGGMLESERI